MKSNHLKCNVAEYAVIINKKGEFLILELVKSKKYSKEAWMLPGGRLETNDASEQGLQREVIEETGLRIKVITPCHTVKRTDTKPAKYSVFFLCRLSSRSKVCLSP